MLYNAVAEWIFLLSFQIRNEKKDKLNHRLDILQAAKWYDHKPVSAFIQNKLIVIHIIDSIRRDDENEHSLPNTIIPHQRVRRMSKRHSNSMLLLLYSGIQHPTYMWYFSLIVSHKNY